MSCRMWLPVFVVAGTLLVTFCAAIGGPGAGDNQAAIEAARKALGERGNYPWYNPREDALQPLPVAPQEPPPPPLEWTWERKPAHQQTPSADWGWSTLFAEALQILAWAALAVLFVLAAIYVGKAMLRRETLQALRGDRDSVAEVDLAADARIESLPFPVRRPQSDLLHAARQQYEAGNFGEAIVYLFSYQLMQLDRSHWIRLAKGKTNRQYLQEVSPHDELQDVLLRTMLTFEDFFFGNHAIDRGRFESCWNQLDHFHHLITPAQS